MITTVIMLLRMLQLAIFWPAPLYEMPDPMVPVPPSWFIPVDKLDFKS
jgi:hypothetical protein